MFYYITLYGYICYTYWRGSEVYRYTFIHLNSDNMNFYK
jgi:hypothetical protein